MRDGSCAVLVCMAVARIRLEACACFAGGPGSQASANAAATAQVANPLTTGLTTGNAQAAAQALANVQNTDAAQAFARATADAYTSGDAASCPAHISNFF